MVNNKERKEQIIDKVAAVQILKEMNLLTQDELYIIYADIRQQLGLPPRNFNNDN